MHGVDVGISLRLGLGLGLGVGLEVGNLGHLGLKSSGLELASGRCGDGLAGNEHGALSGGRSNGDGRGVAPRLHVGAHVGLLAGAHLILVSVVREAVKHGADVARNGGISSSGGLARLNKRGTGGSLGSE